MKSSGPLAIGPATTMKVIGYLGTISLISIACNRLLPTAFLPIFNDSLEQDLILSLVLFQELIGLTQKL